MDIQVIVLVLVLCGLQTAAERESFTLPPPTCPSETVTFTCTVNDSNHYNGGRLATTYWQVGPDSTHRPCAIPHAVSGIVKECGPNNAFVAGSQPPSGSYYTSTLQVIAHPSLNGTSVRCYVPDGRGGERTVGQGRLVVIGAPPTPSFLPINEDDITVREGSVNMTVRWSEPQGYEHISNITSYNITANCTIPSQGSSWVETQTVHDNQKMMSFPVGMVAQLTVRADVCDTVVSNESEVLEICVEAPEPVPHCSTTAVYNGSTDELTDIVVNWSKAMTSCLQNLMAPGLSGIVRSYTLSVNKRTVEQEYICTKDSEQCSYAWNVSANEATNYMVSVAANNVVGQSVTKNCTTTPIGWRNNVLAVSVHMGRHNSLSINCTFLSSFQGVLYLEIWLSNTHSTFASLEFSTVSQQRASAGESVLISNITLKSSTVYFYNVSAVLEDESTPAVVVVQGVITTPSTTKPSTTKPSTSEIHSNSTVNTQSSLPPWVIVVGVTLPLVVVVLIVVIAVVFCLCKFHYHKRIKEICCRRVNRTGEIGSVKIGRLETDSSGSLDDKHTEHEGPRGKKGGPYKAYYRSLSAPQSAKCNHDPSSSLSLITMSESHIDPFRSLPSDIRSQLSKENSLNEDQRPLLENDSGVEQ